MKRRRVFRLTGTLLISLFSGCTGTPQGNQTDEFSFFKKELDDKGINIIKIDRVEKNVELKYETSRTTNQGLGDEIGTISASYVLSRQNGLDTNRLISIINDGSEDIATWHIRSEWVEQFEAEKMSPDEFTAKILNTVELID
jgi:hypothetical protein